MNELQVERATQIASLIAKHRQSALSDSEKKELDLWLEQDPSNVHLFEELAQDAGLGKAIDELQAYDHAAAFERLSGRLFPQDPIPRDRRIWQYIATATLILIAGRILIWLLSYLLPSN